MFFLFSKELYLNIYTYRFFCLTLFTIQIWYFASSKFFLKRGKKIVLKNYFCIFDLDFQELNVKW